MFVVIEGIDGSGKGTVTKAIHDQMASEGHTVDSLSFPMYDKTLYGGMVGRYLNGDFGGKQHPILSGTLYSLDRFEAKPHLEASIKINDLVVSDRYIPSNLCYMAMGSKDEERAEVLQHFVKLEYGLLGLPVPDAIIFLDVPVKFAVQNIAKKNARSYTSKAADLHEADEDYLRKVRAFYTSTLMKFHPRTRFEAIQCERNGHLISIPWVVEKVHSVISQMMQGDDECQERNVH